MVYIIFAAGVILFIYGLMGMHTKELPKDIGDNSHKGFDSMVSDNLLIIKIGELENKLTDIENFLHRLEYNKDDAKNENITQINIKKEYLNDMNREIFILNSEGMSVEDISEKLQITKGEVLLRLGLKK